MDIATTDIVEFQVHPENRITIRFKGRTTPLEARVLKLSQDSDGRVTTAILDTLLHQNDREIWIIKGKDYHLLAQGCFATELTIFSGP